ncbi:hypothetical protein LUZ61_005511 [Rhynchospora tenuis]|uniref:Malectin-like domain-containing protein n=1 Tax=Rhynchospora tenuis TaxID=198213 RepID=A0AAD5ZPR7_9POAL|nr:hypothetical protein LUZ61_005511 [Rhynchospora tenuis]
MKKNESFISLDCGLPSNTTYTDNSTRILYTSDYDYISLAESKLSTISSNLITPSLPRQYRTIRSFPNETRNCYTFKAVEGQRYLIRAGFMYGNYDGLNSAQPNNPLQFDLYVDVNYWMTLDFIDESSIYQPEVLTVALANFLSLCLVNTGSGTPFISLLELRTLNSSMYEFANATHSLSLQFRRSLGPKTGQIIRYPYDPYDLSWPTLSGSPIWTQLSTNLSINTSAFFGAPSAVLQNAATPVNSTALGIMFEEDDSSTKVFFVFYFAELVKLSTNQLREFNIYFNGKKVYGPYSPSYLSSDAIYTTDFITGIHNYSFLLNATENSTLPPLLNAIEVYRGMFLTEPLTDKNEAEAMMSIKEQYQLKKNWMGDPCNPAKYSWQGVKCDYDANNSTIVAVDLTGNNFSGPIPQGLLEKAKEGSLDLRYDCQYDNSCSAHGNSKKKLSTPLIIVIIVVGAILKTLLVFIICKLCWKSRGNHYVISRKLYP